MESNVTDDAKVRVMNTLSRKIEDHNDVKQCTRKNKSKVDILLDDTDKSQDIDEKVNDILEWVRDEELRNGYFLYNSNAYDVSLSNNVKESESNISVPIDVYKIDI